jgi:MFS family permease
LLVAVALSAILAPLNSTMIAVALPGIVEDFGASFASATWLVTAYLVMMASVQPLAGKIGDSIGRRRLILVGLVLFLAVSTGAALAPNIWVLLAFRLG